MKNAWSAKDESWRLQKRRKYSLTQATTMFTEKFSENLAQQLQFHSEQTLNVSRESQNEIRLI
jgi:hypothetical protein